MSDSPEAGPRPSAPSPMSDAVAGSLASTAEGIAGHCLDELTRKAVEDGLYDVDVDAYKYALAQVRKQS